MLNEFTRGELQNQFPGQKGQEAAVLGQGTGMITGRRITGREATAEVGVDMKRNGIVAGPGIIAVEVGAEAEVAVLALDIAETVEEAKMMMRGVVEVGLMGVLPLLEVVLVPRGAHLHIKQLQGVEVQMLAITKSGLPPQKVSPLLIVILIFVALLLILMLMSKRLVCSLMDWLAAVCGCFCLSEYSDISYHLFSGC